MTAHKDLIVHEQEFSGHMYLLHSFDVGDDISLAALRESNILLRRPADHSPYFKNYHKPLTVELPHPHSTSHCESAKIHPFGVITLRYKVPFHATFEDLKRLINEIEDSYRETAVEDAQSLFKVIKPYIKQPKFFYLTKSYTLIQVDVQEGLSGAVLRERYGNQIASTLRFETETLSEYQKDEILEDAFGYYRGDLLVIDTESAFIYDDEYEETLNIFEFANMEHLELQYFDRVLDQQLNALYEREAYKVPPRAYLPLWSTLRNDPITTLHKLRVDISVITERLENSIRLAGEPYYAELYKRLVETLDLQGWRESIHAKLSLVNDITEVYEQRASAVRDDMFNILISILIFLEFVLGILNYLS